VFIRGLKGLIMDWHQLWTIVSLPDNVPIVLLLFVVPFYTWYGLRQAHANDRLIAQLEADPAMAKTHHRKVQPYKPGWAKEVHVWPFLLRIELLATIIVTVILMVWSITLNAPLEEPANPTLTMNPSKAPWYFLGLQEMLVYFDPWIAGVIMPSLIIVGLMVIPYIDANPLGNGYYTYKQRKFAIWTFIFGFIVLWVSMIVIGTLIRGPGWMWFWPGMTWDHNRLIFEINRDLPDIFGIKNALLKNLFGLIVISIYAIAAAIGIHKLVKSTPLSRKIYARMSLLQYVTMQIFLIIMLALPVKILIRLLFRIKYVWITPWFNV
jgi:Cytochrome b(C-terminal)/b6/petD